MSMFLTEVIANRFKSTKKVKNCPETSFLPKIAFITVWG